VGRSTMTDPTIFDNLRVLMEGALYELDLAGELVVTERQDLVDLAALSRSFRMTVEVPSSEIAPKYPPKLELRLSSQFLDFAAEKLAAFKAGSPSPATGCLLEALLLLPVNTTEQSAKVAELHPEQLSLGALRLAGQAVERIAAQIWRERLNAPELHLHYSGTLTSLSSGVLWLEAQFRYEHSLVEEDASAIPGMIDDCLSVLVHMHRA